MVLGKLDKICYIFFQNLLVIIFMYDIQLTIQSVRKVILKHYMALPFFYVCSFSGGNSISKVYLLFHTISVFCSHASTLEIDYNKNSK